MRPHKANKTLGQNFLKSKRALRQIILAAEINPIGQATGEENGGEIGEKILEIGPGKGALTQFLLEAGARVVAVEKDGELVEFLRQKFSTEIANGRLELTGGDILETKPQTLGLEAGRYKLVANIPYYITGQIIRNFLSGDCQPSRAVLLVQREVADRIVAHDGKGSLLSLAVRAYGVPKRIAIVKREDFSPAPNVDSAILLIADISKKFFEFGGASSTTGTEEKFFEILHAGFAHKRKKLIRNLEEIAAKENLEKIFTESGLDENSRAEDLNLNDWKLLLEKLPRDSF
ncbi:MAG: 16S rRNA (adenine(1518)-N(6)/adenine(1519)-N(6))-dimethyltransferase RsmA [Patescibacteria group bacterium]